MSGVLLSPVGLVPLLPALAGLALWFAPARLGRWPAVAAGAVSLAAALALPWQMRADGLLRVDALAAHVSVVAALSVLAGLWFGRRAGRQAALALGVAGLLQLAVLSNNPVLTVAAMQGALLGVLLAPPALAGRGGEAAWRGLLLVVGGLGLALLGAVLLARAGVGVAPPRWDALAEAAPLLQGRPLSVAVALLLAGCAVCAGLAPAHGWQMAVARGRQAVLLAPVMAVALLVLLRVRAVAAGNAAALAPGPVLLVLGLLSVAAAAAWLVAARREPGVGGAVLLLHAGLAVFGFGLGGAPALAGGLVIASAAAILLPCMLARGDGQGRAASVGMAAALALLPPFAGFGAVIAVFGATVRQQPWLAPLLAIGLAVAVAALARRLARMWRAPSGPVAVPDAVAVAVLLALVAGAGVLPAASAWFGALAGGLR